MKHQIPMDEAARADEGDGQHLREVAPDIAMLRTLMVNVVFVGSPGAGERGWVLVDAGLPGYGPRIRKAAEQRFGEGARPAAIVLTHGHFDHIGALRALADEWDAPVYAHEAEAPFLDGSRGYPPPDPAAGGMMSALAPLLPRGPIDVRARLRPLPADGSVPHMERWRWIHTPGHTPGHVSLWREADRSLIAGDAFITTRQESAYAAMISQEPEMHGPPQYFTPDWPAARESVRLLAALGPELAVTGHGHAMHGPLMLDALKRLAAEFDTVAVPDSAKRRA